MNKLHNKILVFIFSILSITIFLASCESYDDFDLEPVAVHPILGEWKVNAFLDGNLIFEDVGLKANQFSTNKNDSVILKDSLNYFWNFQIKVAVIEDNVSFETRNSNNEIVDYNIGVKILNGKIINNDSIYFEIAFEDDETPYGNKYQLKGTRIN
jgi:hypothetical protein